MREDSPGENIPSEFTAGFVAFLGRPNAGKSTLMNAMLGQKVAIVSEKPETTRRAIRGILTGDGFQIVVVDTPGVHRPRTLLGARLGDVVEASIDDVDVIAVCIPANEPIGPGDRRVAEMAQQHRKAKRVAVITKTDAARPTAIAEQLAAVAQLGDWDAVVPVSAKAGDQVDVLVDELAALLPPSPQLYPADALTDDGDEIRVAELIREAALADVRDELPHSIAVVVDELDRSDQKLARIHASLFVERESQKGIVIGRGGSRLRTIGTAARSEIERLLGTKVFLDLHVKVAKEWQRSPKLLDRLGF